MADTSRVNELKLRLGITTTDDDSLLSLLLDDSDRIVINCVYPYKSDVKTVPEKYAYKSMEIAEYLYSKRGAEGETSHSENGISRNYGSASIPNDMLCDIVPFAGVPGA